MKATDSSSSSTSHDRRTGHGHWMMIAFCLPMVVVAVVLAATGVVGYGFILVAIACLAMMAAMMGSMSHADRGSRDHR